ncbi:MAG TPA: thiamine pyrophosphate-requiring protein [Acidimicrobiales bacterium]|nr:thiamine pyrophosphate-requiring protein [Acidimicrobiales bacterium]
MARLVADAVVDRLRSWGVHRIFGYPGEGIDPLLAALRRADGDPEYVGARHEEGAALMATGHAKFSGGPGCCLATHGPGAIHLLNGLYDAKLDGQPVVAIVGQQHRSALGSTYQQEIDTGTLFKDACAAYLATVTVPEQVPLVVDRAVRTALAERAPTAVIVPHDVQALDMPEEPPHRHGTMVSSVGVDFGTVLPSDEALDEAAAVLLAGERPALLVGRGAAHAAHEVLAVADRLGAGIATSLLGKPVLDEDLPQLCGCIGHLGTDAAQRLMDECDTLLMVGTNDPWTEFLPAPGQARAVQVDIDGRHVGMRYPTEVNLVGDAGPTLERVLARLGAPDGGSRREWRHRVEGWVEEWRQELERRALTTAVPLNPQRVFHDLAPRIPDDAMIAVDVGSVTYWYSRYLRLRGRVPAHLSSTLASMGSALPYALAAKLEHPDRPVLALVGDGAMQMNGINELITVADRWRSWSDPRFIVLVLRNDDLNEVTWEQRESEGDPRFDAAQDVPGFDYAGYARLLGLRGLHMEGAAVVESVWDEALAADRPVLVEAVVDPATPLKPPKLTSAQVENLAAGLGAEESAESDRAYAALADQAPQFRR